MKDGRQAAACLMVDLNGARPVFIRNVLARSLNDPCKHAHRLKHCWRVRSRASLAPSFTSAVRRRF